MVMPMAIPLGLALGIPLPIAIAPVLSGGVCGDHCSPLSDTTVMASMFSGSDHIAHVKTQIPYALLSAAISILAYILISINFNSKLLWAITMVLGLTLCYVMIRILSNLDAKRKGIKIPLEK